MRSRAAWRSSRWPGSTTSLAKALVRAPVPIVWEEDTKVPVKPDGADEAAGGLTAH